MAVGPSDLGMLPWPGFGGLGISGRALEFKILYKKKKKILNSNQLLETVEQIAAQTSKNKKFPKLINGLIKS